MRPIRNILVPVDLKSESTALMAIHLAKLFNAELTFLHVVPSRGLSARLFFHDTQLKNATDSITVSDRRAIEKRLGAFLQALPLEDVRYRHRIAEGSVSRQIIRQADSLHPDLLVQYGHDHGAWKERTFGSGASRIMQRAICPVMTVKERPAVAQQVPLVDPSSPPDQLPIPDSPKHSGSFNKILYLTNFGKASQQLLPYAAAIAQKTHSELWLLHVLDAQVDSTLHLPLSLNAKEKLASLLYESQALRPGLKASSCLLQGNPEEEIVSWMNMNKPDLAVMGINQRKEGWMMTAGQFAERIFYACPCPLMTFAPSTEHGDLERHYRRVFRRLTPGDLNQIDARQPDVVGEDLFRNREIFRPSSLFLKSYTVAGLRKVFEEYGIFSLLRQKGFLDLRVVLNLDDPYRQRLRVCHSGREDENHTLIETILHEGILETPSESGQHRSPFFPVLVVEWLAMQNPDLLFSADRPPLPGQKFPGLGLSRQLLELLSLIGQRIGKDGIAIHPKYYHAALLYHRRFVCYNPIQEGQFTALMRDTEDRPVGDVSWAIQLDCLRRRESKGPVSWEIDYQVNPFTDEFRSHFTSDRYRKLFWDGLVNSRYRIDWRLFTKRYSRLVDSKDGFY